MTITNRIKYIDSLRAVAIILMFYAHLLPHYTEIGTSINFAERLFSSLAAPIFLFLLGINFKRTSTFYKTLQRALIVFGLASIIDLFIWGIYPFYSFDVLYTIGFSLLFLQLITRFNNGVKIGLLILLFLATVFLTVQNQYELTLSEPYLGQEYYIFDVAFNLFINGWFPLIPWLAFPLLGHLAQKLSFDHIAIRFFGISTFIAGVWLFYNYDFGKRPFAVEIFYPAHLIYLFISITWLVSIWSNRRILNNIAFRWLDPIGKTSFFLYGFHLTCYHFFADYLIALGLNKWLVFTVFFIMFYSTAMLLKQLKASWKFYANSQVLRIILGD